MKIIKPEEIKYEDKVTFKGIPEDKYYEEIQKLNEKLQKDAAKDSVAKQKSEEVARRFFVSGQPAGIVKSSKIEPHMPAKRVWDCSDVLVFDAVSQDGASEYIAQLKNGERKLDLPPQTFDTTKEIKEADQKFMEFLNSPQLNGIIAEFKNKKDALDIFENYLDQKTIDRPPQPLDKDVLSDEEIESRISTQLSPALDKELDAFHEQYKNHVTDLRFKSNVGLTLQQTQCKQSSCDEDNLENQL